MGIFSERKARRQSQLTSDVAGASNDPAWRAAEIAKLEEWLRVTPLQNSFLKGPSELNQNRLAALKSGDANEIAGSYLAFDQHQRATARHVNLQNFVGSVALGSMFAGAAGLFASPSGAAASASTGATAVEIESFVGPLTGTVEAAPVIGGAGAPTVVGIAEGGGAFIPTAAGIAEGFTFSNLVKGASSLLGLATQSKMADAQIATARAQSIPQPSAIPNQQSFSKTPAATPTSGPSFFGGAPSSNGIAGIPTTVLAGIFALLIVFLFLKR